MTDRKTTARLLVDLARLHADLEAPADFGPFCSLHRPSDAVVELLGSIVADFPGAYQEREGHAWVTLRIEQANVAVHLASGRIVAAYHPPADAVSATLERAAHESAVGVAVRVLATADAPTAFELAMGERLRPGDRVRSRDPEDNGALGTVEYVSPTYPSEYITVWWDDFERTRCSARVLEKISAPPQPAERQRIDLPTCPVCDRPAHASETDDQDRHPECAASEAAGEGAHFRVGYRDAVSARVNGASPSRDENTGGVACDRSYRRGWNAYIDEQAADLGGEG